MTDEPLLVDIVLEAREWEAALPTYAALLRRAAVAALAAAEVEGRGRELCILLADDGRMAALNAAFRDRDRPTNVLSWPRAERGAARPGARPPPPAPDEIELGDLALGFGTCASEAAAAGRDLADHAAHLTVHGVLHLLGYDHQTDADAALMERVETAALSTIGVSDPYSDGRAPSARVDG